MKLKLAPLYLAASFALAVIPGGLPNTDASHPDSVRNERVRDQASDSLGLGPDGIER